jgi:hypothetical protein
MTDVSRLLSLTYGINAAAQTIGTAPGSFATLLPRAQVTSVFPRSRTPIERELYSVDGRRFPRVHGVKDIAAIDVPLEFKGINSNTGVGITVAGGWEAKMEQGNLLASLFGATGALTTAGAAPTVSSGSGASLTVSSTVLADNDIILVTTSTGVEARQVISGGGTTTVTVDRNWVGTPTAASTVIRAARYQVSTSLTAHLPIWFDAEGENWKRRYSDCQPNSMTLNIPNAGLVEFDSQFLPNDWSDQADGSPSFSAPTAGSPIVSGGSAFFIGNRAIMLRNARLTMNNGAVMRETTTGINGVRGGVCTDKRDIMLEGELYVGDDGGAAAIGELIDDSLTPPLNDILGDGPTFSPGSAITTYDIALQVGLAAGAALYIRIPAADIRSAGVREGGPFAVLPFQAMATAPTTGAPMTLGVF